MELLYGIEKSPVLHIWGDTVAEWLGLREILNLMVNSGVSAKKNLTKLPGNDSGWDMIKNQATYRR